MDDKDLTQEEYKRTAEWFNSEQFKLSNVLMNQRLKYHVSVEDASKFLGVSVDDYHRIESGDLDTTPDKYQDYIHLLQVGALKP